MINISRCYGLNLKIFICLLFAFFAGCSGMTIRDDLSPSSPKGYADFANYGLGYVTIYRMQDGLKVKEGFIGYTGAILRVARTPGVYDFIIEHGDDTGQKHSELVNVTIRRDMLTFITVDNMIVEVYNGINDRFQTTTITYRTQTSIAQNPAPLYFESELSLRLLNNLLSDPDWRARLYAIEFLEKSGSSCDKNLIEKVMIVATDDPNRSVRKKADTVLKGRGRDVYKNLLLVENFEANNRTWIDSRGRYNFFYNDEFLFPGGEDGCENVMMTSPPDLPRDFDIELKSTWKKGINSESYGILIGSDENNFNHFGISAHGQAVVQPVRNDEVSNGLIAWTEIPAIMRYGVGQVQQKVEVRGDRWKYYVNDTFIGTITNTMKMNNYAIGLRVCRGQAVAFEQLKISMASKN